MSSVQLRGKLWEICDVAWCRAEPDVGIMTDYVDSYALKDEEGVEFDYDSMTMEEDREVTKIICNMERDEYDEPEGI